MVTISRYLETLIGFCYAIVKRIRASHVPCRFHQTSGLCDCDALDIFFMS
jgi:uncharacterized protein (DUF779 family)